MLLSFENISHYLLDKGLITPASIISGEFSVRDQSSRNTNFAINREYTPSYLVKQVRTHDAEKKESLRIEATCYWLANYDSFYAPLKKFLSKYYEYDYLNHILIIELLKEVDNLHDHFRKENSFAIQVANQMADILASYHTHDPGFVEQQKSYTLFKKRKPWVFSLPESNLSDWLNNTSSGNGEKQSIKLILENKEFVQLAKSIGDDWERKSLIHGDVKFPNFLIHHQGSSDLEVRLIDWELADIGDPLWDVAAVIQNYLTLWIASEVNQEQSYGKEHIVQLEDIQPSIAAFWNRYTELCKWDTAFAKMQLSKTLRYIALKLVHTCFETVQGVKNMPVYSARILQVSLNLLKFPEQAISELLAIDLQTKHYATNII